MSWFFTRWCEKRLQNALLGISAVLLEYRRQQCRSDWCLQENFPLVFHITSVLSRKFLITTTTAEIGSSSQLHVTLMTSVAWLQRIKKRKKVEFRTQIFFKNTSLSPFYFLVRTSEGNRGHCVTVLCPGRGVDWLPVDLFGKSTSWITRGSRVSCFRKFLHSVLLPSWTLRFIRQSSSMPTLRNKRARWVTSPLEYRKNGI